MANRKKIARHTRQYQLRNENPTDQHVASILDFWKGDRQELSNFRKAITIFYALQQNDINPLLQMFPFVKEAINSGAGDIDEMKKMLELIIARQKAAPVPNYTMQPPAPVATGKPIGGFKPLAAPSFDDDSDDVPVLAVKKNTSVNASANFLESMRTQV